MKNGGDKGSWLIQCLLMGEACGPGTVRERRDGRPRVSSHDDMEAADRVCSWALGQTRFKRRRKSRG